MHPWWRRSLYLSPSTPFHCWIGHFFYMPLSGPLHFARWKYCSKRNQGSCGVVLSYYIMLQGCNKSALLLHPCKTFAASLFHCGILSAFDIVAFCPDTLLATYKQSRLFRLQFQWDYLISQSFKIKENKIHRNLYRAITTYKYKSLN